MVDVCGIQRTEPMGPTLNPRRLVIIDTNSRRNLGRPAYPSTHKKAWHHLSFQEKLNPRLSLTEKATGNICRTRAASLVRFYAVSRVSTYNQSVSHVGQTPKIHRPKTYKEATDRRPVIRHPTPANTAWGRAEMGYGALFSTRVQAPCRSAVATEVYTQSGTETYPQVQVCPPRHAVDAY